MSVGERIQYYRKKLSMSQEELAKKLFVSRQTISLWETDQTLPTIENLLLLKDIFGVSIDNILCDSEELKQIDETESEKYKFSYSEEKIKSIGKIQKHSLIKRIIIQLLSWGILFAFFAATEAPKEIYIVFGFAMAIVIIIDAVNVFKAIEMWKGAKLNLESNIYSLLLTNEKICLTIERNDEIVKKINYSYSSAKLTQKTSEFYIINIDNQELYIDKSMLKDDSILIEKLNNSVEVKKTKSLQGKYKAFSGILIACSILSILPALISVGIATGINGMFTDNMWLFFLFLPIPLASIALGVYLEAKKYKGKSNIVVGIVMAALLCIYGSFAFIFGDVYDNSGERVVVIEEKVGFDIPEYKRVVTQNYGGAQSQNRIIMDYKTDIYFDSDVANELANQLKNSGEWISQLPTDILALAPIVYCQGADYFYLYNVNTEQINQKPSNSGEYSFILIGYCVDKKQMSVVEYTLEFVK